MSLIEYTLVGAGTGVLIGSYPIYLLHKNIGISSEELADSSTLYYIRNILLIGYPITGGFCGAIFYRIRKLF